LGPESGLEAESVLEGVVVVDGDRAEHEFFLAGREQWWPLRWVPVLAHATTVAAAAGTAGQARRHGSTKGCAEDVAAPELSTLTKSRVSYPRIRGRAPFHAQIGVIHA